jgi:outer membrane protein
LAATGRNWQHLSADSNSFTPNSDFARNGDTYGAEFKQPIFRGFQTLSETDEAEKQVLAGRARLQSVEQQLLLDTGKAFLDTLRDEEILQIDRDEETVLQKKLEETSVRAKVGDLTKTDVRQAQTRLSKAEVTREQAENTLTSDRASFLRLVGLEPEKLSVPQLAVPDGQTISDVLHAADTINPSVVSAQYIFEAAKDDIDLNKGSLLPEIDLVGTSSNAYGQSSIYPGRSITNQVMVQATWQLYDGGASYSKIREARQTATQHRMELEDARHKAHETGRNAWQELQSAEAAIKSDQDEVTAASEALQGVKTEAHVGARTTLDVLNAEQELLDAKVDLAKARHDRDYAVLEIKSATGDLTADHLKLQLETYNPEKHYSDNSGKLIGFGDDDDYVVGEKNKLANNN